MCRIILDSFLFILVSFFLSVSSSAARGCFDSEKIRTLFSVHTSTVRFNSERGAKEMRKIRHWSNNSLDDCTLRIGVDEGEKKKMEGRCYLLGWEKLRLVIGKIASATSENSITSVTTGLVKRSEFRDCGSHGVTHLARQFILKDTRNWSVWRRKRRAKWNNNRATKIGWRVGSRIGPCPLNCSIVQTRLRQNEIWFCRVISRLNQPPARPSPLVTTLSIASRYWSHSTLVESTLTAPKKGDP